MTIEDLEQLARQYLRGLFEDAAPNNTPAAQIARALLAMLPVVKAAESVRGDLAVKPRPTDAEVRLARTIDSLRAALAGIK